MTRVREISSSPHSSGDGADSYKDGTPDTRLTVFSPDEGSARSNKLFNTMSATNGPSDNHPVRFSVHVKTTEGYRNTPVAAEKDPFVSSHTSSKLEQKLSPTASAFRPISVPLIAHGSLGGKGGPTTGPPADLLHPGLQTVSNKFSHQLRISRYLVLFSSKGIKVAEVEDFLRKLEQLGSPCLSKRHILQEGGQVYLRFTNIQDTRNVQNNVTFGNQDWRAEYISPFDFYQVTNPGGSVEAVSEGQVEVFAIPIPGVSIAIPQIDALVHNFLQNEGEIFAFQQCSELSNNTFRAMVEFCDVDVAVAVASKLNGFTVHGVQLLLALSPPGITVNAPSPVEAYPSSRAPMRDISAIFQGMSVSNPISNAPQATRAFMPTARGGQSPLGLPVPQQHIAMYPTVVYHGPAQPRFMLDQTPTRSQSVAPLTPMTPMTPMPGNMPMMGPMYTPPATPMMAQHSDYGSPRSLQAYGRQNERRQNAMRVSRSPYYNAAGHHNHVDVNRIREGIDVRTTIMLRNIPNKVDQAMLKRIVDESSWGKYDFMYLRIDFANDCNVGYAFINFVDPLDIIDFVNARGNQRWNCFKSDKVAEISYARKDCLVQKFRNSSVMLEAQHYRPKLYFTSNGPRPDLAGEEEPFPEPDNQSKMKRSCENAEHVGLFTPNAGQHFRDEQRRRRSQYDRGTRLAALEEYDYDTHIQQQGLYPSQ
ncbi:RNA recognition motif 2-domain-containing protein [Bombardia bombarda]|uniref:RNA recognition motif 2-domain-containing protein n=1 Tax=Bombardia bombarda TaxID=252184 RepID=A0AA40C979_9PEZI|nr:RNA recognition motif 2-domain-containing protein [Bombardia bombarda]